MATGPLITLFGEAIEVGDRVWHWRYGWGVVIGFEDSQRPIRVRFVVHSYWFTEDGREDDRDCFPALFWSELDSVPIPAKPKRKVKKCQWAFRLSTTEKYSISESREEPSLKWVNFQMIEGSEETVEE